MPHALTPRWVKRSGDLDLWPFDLESGVQVTCDVEGRGLMCRHAHSLLKLVKTSDKIWGIISKRYNNTNSKQDYAYEMIDLWIDLWIMFSQSLLIKKFLSSGLIVNYCLWWCLVSTSQIISVRHIRSVIFVTKIKTRTRIIGRRFQRTRTRIIVIQKTKTK